MQMEQVSRSFHSYFMASPNAGKIGPKVSDKLETLHHRRFEFDTLLGLWKKRVKFNLCTNTWAAGTLLQNASFFGPWQKWCY